jgi:hypothetical protein
MTLPAYDIFRKDGAEALIWVGAATDLESARVRIRELSRRVEAEFVVFDQHTQEMVASFKTPTTNGNGPMRERL